MEFETDHEHSLLTIKTLTSNLYCAAHIDSSYSSVFQSERIGISTAQRLSFYFSKNILTLETKDENKQ